MPAFDRPRLGDGPDGISRRNDNRFTTEEAAKRDKEVVAAGGNVLETGALTTALPKSADLMRVFTMPPEGDSESHPVLEAGAALSAHHRAQWAAEDACRDNGDDDRLVAKAKRTIDAMNTRRVELVDQIDAWAVGICGVAEAALHTETLGQLIDRLAVAWVRSWNLIASAGSDPGRRADARRALTQLAELCDAYDDLARDVREGRRRLPSWRSLKRYGGVR